MTTYSFFHFHQVQDNKCIVLNWNFATALAVVRSVTDAIYFLHMLLQVSATSLLLIQIRSLHFVKKKFSRKQVGRRWKARDLSMI